jgi:polysaccharide pyruvyl transferase WcaK-like protein
LVPYLLFETKYASAILNRFLRKYVKLTPRRFHSFDALQRNPPAADIYVTGSDQVWNGIYNAGVDRTFYLDFAPAGATRIAYAASFGLEELPEDQLAATRRLIHKYNAISVREESALRILEELGWSGATHVLDPTLMLNRADWAKLASPRPRGERYLLIYSVEGASKEPVLENARLIARRLQLKIYQAAGGIRSRIKGCDKVFYFVSPGHFLSLLLNAEFVVASSFHGTAFSINLNRPFISVMPRRYTGRAASLLKILGLEDRLVVDSCDLHKVLAPIDYERVNRQLDTERDKSRSFLVAALDKT